MNKRITLRLVIEFIEFKYRLELRFGRPIGLNRFDTIRLKRLEEEGDEGGSVDDGTCKDSKDMAGAKDCLRIENVRLIFSPNPFVRINAYLIIQSIYCKSV